ncbi:A disintegrin and metalloproteinase with thrombospondin motifs 16 [Saguinus oedipus]|uniref:A disintegrin and metalloproteinase with thrombospondin motifs 16 n=1 Tax=Saguinus oedipus TaxID=9490 RepID=A0ABQ9W7F2_SAGOE|nr:A disintegrin and metalloproteinase with thrombospondin motifs 16 [Saguinus oedipus]
MTMIFTEKQPKTTAQDPDELQEYDLVSAYEVDHRGDYVSHEIMHHQRRRRAVAPSGADSLHLRLKGSRHDFHVDLRTSSSLVSPGFIVQTLGKRGTKSVQTLPPEDFCFYQGSLRSHRNSSVALSTCQGLAYARNRSHLCGSEVCPALQTWVTLDVVVEIGEVLLANPAGMEAP